MARKALELDINFPKDNYFLLLLKEKGLPKRGPFSFFIFLL